MAQYHFSRKVVDEMNADIHTIRSSLPRSCHVPDIQQTQDTRRFKFPTGKAANSKNFMSFYAPSVFMKHISPEDYDLVVKTSRLSRIFTDAHDMVDGIDVAMLRILLQEHHEGMAISLTKQNMPINTHLCKFFLFHSRYF